ncbi:MAG TPA: NDP-sugar synthase [Actinomycetota bacterium]|nr:NDP-sugar synthase [Actinomycetota bacterium]
MKALVLAGGLGTRLRPLTYTRPKHLLPIANRPHVEHVFDLLLRHGVDGVVLLTSYLAEAFADAAASAAARGLDVEVTHEAEPLGTAGALKNAQHLVGDDTFLAFNGDVLTDVDLSELVAFHRDRGAEATLLLTPVDDPSAYGVVPTGDDGRVEGFVEKPPRDEATTNLINAGVYVLEPSVLDRIPAGEVWSAERQLFPELVSSGAPLYARGTHAYWMDIGTPDKYLAANLDALAGRFATDAVASPGPGAVLAAGSASVDDGARVRWACLGDGVKVGRGAVVERAVLLPGALVSEGAVVVDAILGAGAAVAPGAEVRDAAVADGDTIEDGAQASARKEA